MSIITRQPNLITIAHSEAKRSESFTATTEKSTRVLVCAWPDRLTLAREIVGQVILIAPGWYHIVEPHPHPSIAGCVARNVEIDDSKGIPTGGVYADTSQIEHQIAFLTVTYESDQADDGDGGNFLRIGDERIGAEVSFLQVPGEKLFWDANQEEAVEGEAPTILQAVQTWDITLNDLPSVPPLVWSLVGKVNDAAVTSTRWGNTFAAETLLLLEPSLKTAIVRAGLRTYTVTIRLLYRQQGWNKFYRRGNDASDTANGYQSIYGQPTVPDTPGDEWKPYAPASFSGLLALIGS